MYRIYIQDRNYMCWSLTDLQTNKTVDSSNVTFSPQEKQLFTNDIISQEGNVVYSYIRECPTLAGMLILENSKTYGRTENKKRLLYKCIPDDKRLPAFLVPYDMKLGFSKQIHNKYVVFKFDQWLDTHPRGMLVEVLGDVDKLEVFYEYKLYCRNLNIPANFNKEFAKKVHKMFPPDRTQEYVDKIMANENFQIIDRTEEYVFTIDPKHSLDFDDGFSISSPDPINGNVTITIYIANVFFWMETFQLWKSFHQRVATIYLPDRRRPMLPTILSDNLCSLLENQPRFAFTMDIQVSPKGEILNIKYSNSLIRVRKNYIYEESALLKNKNFQQLLKITQVIMMSNNSIDSHDLVTFWMIFMNKQCGKDLYSQKTGIYRSVLSKQTVDKSAVTTIENDQSIQKETKQFLKNWLSIYGQYVVFSEDKNLEHSLLNTNTYIHITSPIRRLVDLLNQIMLMTKRLLVSKISEDATQFLENWKKDIDIINERMKSTAKIERECEIMRKCLTNPKILLDIHDAYVVNIREDSSDQYKYILYLENEKIILTTKSEEKKELYKKYQIRLFKIESYGIASKIKIGWV